MLKAILNKSKEGLLKVEIPAVPPGVNRLHGYGRGHIYLSKEAVAWSTPAALIIGAEAAKQGWKKEHDNYGFILVFSGSKLDTDAPIKLVLDTLSRKLGFDDKIVSEIVLVREPTKEKKLTMILYPILGQNND